jgi:hypothetical protein
LIISNKTVPKQLAVAIGMTRETPRNERELRVIEDLIKPDPRFGQRASELAAVVVEAKRLSLEGESPEKILRFLEERLFPSGQEQPELEGTEAALAGSAD